MSRKNCQNICKKASKVILFLVFAFLSYLTVFSKPILASGNETISFQGKIVRNDTGYEGLNVSAGNPTCVVSGDSNDTCDFKALYYTASSGGTLLGTEEFTNEEIGQYEGVFNLSLGTGSWTGGSESTFLEVFGNNDTVYVELQFAPNGSTYTETFSRMSVGASAYAIRAGRADIANEADSAFQFDSAADDSGYTPSAGMVYYDSDEATLKLYNGSSWVDISSGGGSSLFTDAGDYTYLTSTSDNLVLGASSYTAIGSSTYAAHLTGLDTASTPFAWDTAANRLIVDGATAQSGLTVYSNYDSTGEWPLVSFKADHSGFTEPILEITQDGTGSAITAYYGSSKIFEVGTQLESAVRKAVVGIGVDTPDERLDINGAIHIHDFTPSTTTNRLYSVGGTLYWSGNEIGLGTNLWVDSGTLTYLSSTTDDLVLGASTSTNAPFFFDVSEGSLTVNGTGSSNILTINDELSDSSPFVIDASGNVGIGTSSPSAKLDIAGTSSTISNNSGDITVIAEESFVVKADDTDSDNIMEWMNSTGGILAYIDSYGKLVMSAATTSNAQVNLATSTGVDVYTPSSGDLWWNGTNLYFNDGNNDRDLFTTGRSVFTDEYLFKDGFEGDSYTKALFHFDGNDGSTTFIDETEREWIAEDTAELDIDQKKFGTSSGYFSGGDAYTYMWDDGELWLDDGSDSNEWTIDFWIRFDEDPAGTMQGIYQHYEDTENYVSLLYWTGYLDFYVVSGGSTLIDIYKPWDVDADTWYHVAVVKQGTTGYKMFIDGTQIGSTETDTDTLPHYSGSSYALLGDYYDGGNDYLDGWIDEFRISKGIARWTSNFTPETEPYGDVYKWSGISNDDYSSTSTQSTIVHSGDYAQKFSLTADESNSHSAYVTKSLSSGLTDYYTGFYLYLPSDFDGCDEGSDYWNLLRIYDSSWDTRLNINIGQGDYIGMTVYDSSQSSTNSNDTTTLTKEVWHKIELYHKVDDEDGEYSLWIDGEERLSASDIDTGSTDAEIFMYGSYWSLYGVADDIYMDDIRISPNPDTGGYFLRFINDGNDTFLVDADGDLTTQGDIISEGTLSLGSSGNRGSIRYNETDNVIEFSNDGSTWIPLGAATSKIIYSPEYAGAVLAADGSSNVGSMTSDSDSSSNNYYEWNSSETSLNDYDVRVRFTLPSDFESWDTTAVTFNFVTEDTGTNSLADIYLYLSGSGTIDGSSTSGASSSGGTWTTMTIPGADLDECDSAEETCIFIIRMYSANDSYVRIGDIELNYNRAL